MADEKPKIREINWEGTGEIVVEAIHWRNNPVIFPPVQARLRSRFVKSNLKGDEYVPLIEEIPDSIPGQRIRVRIRERQAFIFDPLGEPESKELFARLAQVLREKRHENVTPQPNSSYGVIGEPMTETELKTWLVKIRELLDHHKFSDGNGNVSGGPLMVLVDGSVLPPMAQIMKLPGDVRYNFFSNSSVMSRIRGKPHATVAAVEG